MKDCIIKNFRYTNSTGRNLFEAYKEEYHKSLSEFLIEYKDNTESLYLNYIIEEWTTLIPEFKEFINSIKKHQDETFYYIRNRIITTEESQEINKQIETENKHLSSLILGISINEELRKRELEEEKCIELLNKLLATGSKFLEFLKNRLKEIEGSKPQQIKSLDLPSSLTVQKNTIMIKEEFGEIFSNYGFELFEHILNEYIKPKNTKGRYEDLSYYYRRLFEDKFIHQKPEPFRLWFIEKYTEEFSKIKTKEQTKNIARIKHYSNALDWFRYKNQ